MNNNARYDIPVIIDTYKYLQVTTLAYLFAVLYWKYFYIFRLYDSVVFFFEQVYTIGVLAFLYFSFEYYLPTGFFFYDWYV